MEEKLICDCGYTWFERKTIARLQLSSKFLPLENFVPYESMELARCLYCGRYFDKDGKEVNVNNLNEDDFDG